MPTIEITSSALGLPERRRIALRLSRWFAARGIAAARVIVQFEEIPARSVFSGGVVLAVDASGVGVPRYISVRCCISIDRDDVFQQALAQEICEAVGADQRSGFFYLRIEKVEKSDVYLAIGGPLIRADTNSETRTL